MAKGRAVFLVMGSTDLSRQANTMVLATNNESKWPGAVACWKACAGRLECPIHNRLPAWARIAGWKCLKEQPLHRADQEKLAQLAPTNYPSLSCTAPQASSASRSSRCTVPTKRSWRGWPLLTRSTRTSCCCAACCCCGQTPWRRWMRGRRCARRPPRCAALGDSLRVVFSRGQQSCWVR